jgi:hypothetical protein
MTDTPTPGDRVDAAIEAARQALTDLRTQLQAKAAEIGPEINAAVDAVQAKIEEISAAVDERQGQ